MVKRMALAAAVVSFMGCASSPQLYTNDHYNKVGRAQADRDIEECEQLADDNVSGKGKAVARNAGKGAAVGGAVGGVLGLLGGGARGALGGAVVGGAVGGTAGAASTAVSPNQAKKNFTVQCLTDRGYRVIGWD